VQVGVENKVNILLTTARSYFPEVANNVHWMSSVSFSCVCLCVYVCVWIVYIYVVFYSSLQIIVTWYQMRSVSRPQKQQI